MEPTTVYMEGFTGDLYLDKPQEIERYNQAFTSIWDTAVDAKDTQNMLHQAAKEFAR
ncbi:Scr1 family TA system antitoxin-like transcriptional regulator [Streptomyces sp. NPDC002055]|uniref:Scr1 family TA system antitoxin-like transcriptional regulator n=1 Tax=Streptomyces sp. NPDC002055 TaxID=3154534 RepID=UPI003326CA30